MTIEIRKAVALDQPEIVALVHSERLNPTGLDWRNFCVAVLDGHLVGAVQIRPHAGKAREVGSFVVARGLRGCALGGRLLDYVLRGEAGDVHAITVEGLMPYFSAWGFTRQALCQAPRPVVRNALLGQAAGSLAAILQGQPPRRVVILRRPAGAGERRVWPRHPRWRAEQPVIAQAVVG